MSLLSPIDLSSIQRFQSSRFIRVGPLLITMLLAFGCGKAEAPVDGTQVTEANATEEASDKVPADSHSTATGAACPTPTQSGSGVHHAAVVVAYGDRQSEAICVAFDEDQLSAYEVLERSGLELVSKYYQNPKGYTICKISSGTHSDGCDDPNNCFCQASYWAFWTQDEGTWGVSNLGVADVELSDGSIQGQKWGEGESSGPPPACTFEDICGAGSGDDVEAEAPLESAE